MKMIIAIIQPTKLRAVRDALVHVGVERITICDAQGYGRQRGHSEALKAEKPQTRLLRKVTLEIAVNDDFLDRAIGIISEVARTGSKGEIGDGKIFILPLVDAIQVDDGIRGKQAV